MMSGRRFLHHPPPVSQSLFPEDVILRAVLEETSGGYQSTVKQDRKPGDEFPLHRIKITSSG